MKKINYSNSKYIVWSDVVALHSLIDGNNTIHDLTIKGKKDILPTVHPLPQYVGVLSLSSK